MKILHILLSPRAEGTPKLVLDWLTVKEYEQKVLFLEEKPIDLIEFFPKNHIYINNSLIKGYKKIVQIKKIVKEICINESPDLVIAWDTGLSHWIHWGAKLAGVKKLLTHCGNAPGKGFKEKYLYSYISFGMNYFFGAKIICCSNYIKKQFCNIQFLPKSIFFAVYNCINTEKFFPLQENAESKNIAIMVATLENHKDHTTILETWKILESQNYDYQLWLVGKGRNEQNILKKIKELELKNVTLWGSRNDVPVLLRKAKIFVFSTTKAEGFGTVLIEALASGLPVIATDVPACREVLEGGNFGELIPEKCPQIFASKIIEKFESTESSEIISKRIRYSKSFTPENMIKQYVEIANKK